MKKFRRLLCLPLIAALCLGLMVPLPAQAADIYFTSVNDRLLPDGRHHAHLVGGGAVRALHRL